MPVPGPYRGAMLPTRVPATVAAPLPTVAPHVVLGSVDGPHGTFQAHLQLPETVQMRDLERVMAGLPTV